MFNINNNQILKILIFNFFNYNFCFYIFVLVIYLIIINFKIIFINKFEFLFNTNNHQV